MFQWALQASCWQQRSRQWGPARPKRGTLGYLCVREGGEGRGRGGGEEERGEEERGEEERGGRVENGGRVHELPNNIICLH